SGVFGLNSPEFYGSLSIVIVIALAAALLVFRARARRSKYAQYPLQRRIKYLSSPDLKAISQGLFSPYMSGNLWEALTIQNLSKQYLEARLLAIIWKCY